MDQREMTTGEQRVRYSFNPSQNEDVEAIKWRTAQLIDYCEGILKPQDARLAALAQTAYEEAAMWAVKAATSGK